VRVSVIGCGSWGTAWAFLLGRNGACVQVWDGDRRVLDGIARDRRNPLYLADTALPETVRVCPDVEGCVSGADIVLIAVPAQAVREVCSRGRDALLSTSATLVSASKGLETDTGARMSEVIREVLGEAVRQRLVALSGPNLAVEMCRLMPAATVVAGAVPSRLAAAQAALSAPTLRVYTCPDIAGVELGGALKNVVAVAAGMTDGLGFGDNTKASLITRGLAEMTRLGIALGARAETFVGLSGVGDLVATCSSRTSRNWRVGHALAQGRSLQEACRDLGMVAEGPPTARAVLRLSHQTGVEMPISAQVHAVLFEGRTVPEAAEALMSRPLRDERVG